MPLVLRRDPRPTGYDSVTEAVFADNAGDIVDAAVESNVWAPILPSAPAATPTLVFVDGVERRECRVWGIGDGLPRLGLMVSYAAGAIVPSDADPLRHVSVRHRILMTKGATTPPIHLIADNVTVEYLPEHNAGEDAESIFSSLRQLRSDLETAVVLRVIEEDAGLIVVDGRLPPVTHHRTLGFIKTPHQIPLSQPDQIETLTQLRRGERTPVFRRRRSARDYYSWFLGLCDLGPFDVPLSNLALLEIDDSIPRAQAIEIAD